ncbi:MAG: GC-type dockerin domain-anchored protein [Phycisphaerales bacterium]
MQPRTEGIHLNPGTLQQTTQVIACILAHEWYHTNQNATDYQGAFEVGAYQHEIACLVALGQTGTNRHMQMVNCLASLTTAPQSPPFDKGRPAEGGKIDFTDTGWSYSMGSDFPGFYISSPNNVSMYGHLVNVSVPYDFVFYTVDTHKYITISGYEPSTQSGVLLTYEQLGDGQSFPLRSSQTIPNAEPFSLAISRDKGRLYILDTRNDAVLRYGPLATSGIFAVPDGEYANSSTLPALEGALAISTNIIDERRGMTGDSLIIDYHDTRAEGAIVVDRPRAVLFDDDGDGAADRAQTMNNDNTPITWRDFIAVVPGFLDAPAFADTSVRVFAGAGVNLQIHSVESDGTYIETLATGVMPSDDNEATFNLSRPLNPCEYIRAVDIDNSGVLPAYPVFVPNPADLADPPGMLDFSDVFAFLVAFGNMQPQADLADPQGVFDFSDVFAYLVAFGAGCQ